MANIKIGLAYYNVDTDRYQDIRIKRLKREFGCDGIAVYDYILCEIYRVRGCFIAWDESTAFDVAEYFGLKETTVGEIVNYCCCVGLFDKELRASGSILTSSSIQRRYIEMCRRAKRNDIRVPEEYAIIPEECQIIPEQSPIIREVCRKVEYSKVKKSKVEGRSEGGIPPPTPSAGEAYVKFSNWVKKKLPNVSKLKSQITEEEFDKLISQFDKNKIIDILEQMENKADLAKRYTSAYLTALKWLKRDQGEPAQNKTMPL